MVTGIFVKVLAACKLVFALGMVERAGGGLASVASLLRASVRAVRTCSDGVAVYSAQIKSLLRCRRRRLFKLLIFDDDVPVRSCSSWRIVEVG